MAITPIPSTTSMTAAERAKLTAIDLNNLLLGGAAASASSVIAAKASKTIASAASAVYNGVKFEESAVTITGNTGITTATGFNYVKFEPPAISGDTATCTITNAATVYISGPPVAGANVAITNRAALVVGSGRVGIGTNAPGVDLHVAASTATEIDCVTSTNTSIATVKCLVSGVGGYIRSYGASFTIASLANKFAMGPDGASGLVLFSNAFNGTDSTGTVSIRGGGYDTGAEKIYCDRYGTKFTNTSIIASAANAVYDGVKLAASTVLIGGAIAITTSTGFNAYTLNAPTYVGDTATCAITSAATLYVSGAPIASTNVTISNTYALWIDDGSARFDGRILGAQGADVTAANDITLGNGNYFDVTGATEVQRILGTGWTAGSLVTLQFDSNPNVKHNTAAGAGYYGLQLAGAGDFAASAGDTLTLRFDGAWWREVARAVI